MSLSYFVKEFYSYVLFFKKIFLSWIMFEFIYFMEIILKDLIDSYMFEEMELFG